MKIYPKLLAAIAAMGLVSTSMAVTPPSQVVSRVTTPSCPGGVNFTPLCLIPHIVDGVLLDDIYEVLKYPQRGAIFAGSEVEPHIAVNPTDPNNVAIAWMQDRAARLGGGLALVVTATENAFAVLPPIGPGPTWRTTVIPFTRAGGAPQDGAPGSFDRATDPWLAFDIAGNLYFTTNNFDGLTKHVGGAVSIVKSTDKGRTWGPVINIATKGGIGVRAFDRPTLTPDPRNASILYAHYIIYGSDDGKSDMYVAKSVNGGQTWESKKIYTVERDANQGAKEGSQVIGELKVLPNGTLVVVFMMQDAADYADTKSFKLGLIRSFDEGRTWEKNLIPIIPDVKPKLVFDPTLRDKSGATVPIRGSLNSFPSITMDPETGTLYVAYGDGVTKESKAEVRIVRVSNVGIKGRPTISTPVTVSDTSKNAFMPAAYFVPKAGAPLGDGTLGVGYFEMENVSDAGCVYSDSSGFTKNNGAEDCPLTTNVILKQFNSNLVQLGVPSGDTLTATPIDYRKAPLLFGPGGAIPGGLFLGDYFGLTSAAGKFLVAYPNTNNEVRTCDLLMNPLTFNQAGEVVPQTVGAIYFPDNPNAIASNNCNRDDIFYTRVDVISP